MNIHRVQPSEVPGTFELLIANGWGHRLVDVDRFAQLVDASQIADVVVVNDRVVGFARGITDGLSNGYLSMVVVEPNHRGKGIGRKLVEHAIGRHPGITWVLRAGREGAADFFAKLGFAPSTVAMERKRI